MHRLELPMVITACIVGRRVGKNAVLAIYYLTVATIISSIYHIIATFSIKIESACILL